MKNRYKALIIVLSFIALVAIIAIIIGFGFHLVKINEFGYSRNRVFGTVDDKNVFTMGRYFIGVDHQMVKFPKGLIKYELLIHSNTIDKSYVSVEALFLGQFIPSLLSKVNLEYGNRYSEMLQQAIELSIRQTLEQYSLTRILSRRSEVEGEVFGRVQESLQKLYPFVKCRLVSLGAVGTDLPNTATQSQNPTLYELRASNLKETFELQKQVNFLNSGGQQLLKTYESFHAQMFLDVMTSCFNGTSPDVDAGLYLMSEPITKGIDLNHIEIKL